MERKVPKKLIASLVGVFFLLIVCLTFFVDSLLGGKFGGVFRKSPALVQVSINDEKLFPDQESFVLPQENLPLTLKNNEKEDLQFYLFSDSNLLYEGNLSAGQEVQISPELGKSLSFVFSGKTVAEAWITDSHDVKPAMEKLQDKADLFFWNEVKIENVSFNAAFSLFGAFSFDELAIKTDRSDKIVISPSNPFCGELYVFAPDSKVYTRNFSLGAKDASASYYIKARAWNGKKLDLNAFPIQDFKQLKRLSDDSLLPVLTQNPTITILNSFELSEPLTISGQANLIFNAPLDFGENTLTFTHHEKGRFFVQSKVGTCPSAQCLIFLAPKCSLLWQAQDGVGTIPALSTVQKYSNLLSYNGNETTLGGEGTAVPELVLPAAQNSFLENSLTFDVRGNCLVAKLPIGIKNQKIEDAVYSLSALEGKAELLGTVFNGLVTTRDKQGKERRFSIVIERENNNIPVLYIETENAQEITSKSQYLSATFKLDGEDTLIPSVVETHIRIRGRGNSTWKWDKKPYKIHFDEPVSLLGLPAAEEWALFANFADKSLMRNRIAQDMASKLSFSYCPTHEYVDLFVNGEYMGVYGIGEHLESGEGRVEVQQDMTKLDCGFFLEAGGVVAGVDVKGMNYFHAGLVKFVLIKTPEYNALTSEQFDYIKDYMQAADAAVKQGEGYEEYIDMDSLVDWLIMIEMTNNTDCAWRRSTYFTKQPGGKLVMGPVWDFDLAFGNFSKDVAGFNTWVSTSEDDYVGETWSTYLLQDEKFQKRFKARWNEVKDLLLETAMESIDRDFELLYPSAQQNFERWDILGKKVAFERHDTKNYKTYVSQIDYLKEFLINRADWIDAQIEEW